MRIPIVFSTDHNFVLQTGVCLYSLMDSAVTSEYDIYVIFNNDVTDEDKALLCKQVNRFEGHSIEFIEIGDTFEGAFEIRNVSIASYSRLLIPWLLHQYDSVIYSDVDIIFKTDLEEVYRDGMPTDFLIAAVVAVGFTIDHEARRYAEKIGITPEKYINAGFLVINSKLFRDENLNERLLDEARKSYTFQDQDILNIVCKNRIHYLPAQYNLTPWFYRLYKSDNEVFKKFYNYEDAQKIWLSYNGCVIHYAGAKPWNKFTYAWRAWWDAYRASIFYDPKFEQKVSREILNPHYSWRGIASIIKRKIL